LFLPPANSAIRLINASGTFYLVQNSQLYGITSPGILTSYGFAFSQSKPASVQDLSLPKAGLLTPNNGSLVKSLQDPTIYLISGNMRYGFVSAKIFIGSGFKFSSVLTVTNPELQVLPKGPFNLSQPLQHHLAGLDVNIKGTIYWIGGDNTLHAYPSLEVYNSWHLPNDFSRVVVANAADAKLPISTFVVYRAMQ
jgi:hypothetical protein